MSSSNSKRLTTNIFLLTLVQISTYVLPLISVPIVSRIIGPGRYGIINFGAACITYFTLVISYSFDFTATRKIAADPTNEVVRNTVFSEVISCQVLLFTLSTMAFLGLLFTVPEFKENKTVIVFSYLLCISTLFTQNWLFQAMQDLSKVAIFNFVSKLLFTTSIIIFVRKADDYIWQPFLIAIIQAGVAIWSFVWAYRKYNLVYISPSFKRCLQVLNEDKIMFISLICVSLYSYTNIVILGLFQTNDQVGFYTSAQRLIAIAQSVLTMPLSMSFYPFIGSAFGESRDRGMQVAQKLIPLIVIFVGSACLVMFLAGPLIIRLFYGEAFSAAGLAFQILSITPLLFSLNNVLGVQIMLNLKMDKQFLYVNGCAGIISVMLSIFLVKQWGFIGSAITATTTELILLGSMSYLLLRRNLNPFNMGYFRPSMLVTQLQPLKYVVANNPIGKFFTGRKQQLNDPNSNQ